MGEEMIMMAPALRPWILAFLVTLFIAGSCMAGGNSGTQPAFSGVTGTVQADLSRMGLTQNEVPFPVASVMSNTVAGDYSANAPVQGVTRIHTIAFIGNTTPSKPGRVLSQAIVKCSPGNASSVYYYLYQMIPDTQSGGNYIRVLEHPGIGEKSFAFTTTQQYGQDRNYVMRGILFQKADVVEYILVMYPDDDPVAITAIARTAAAKVPAAGIRSTVMPPTVPTKKPTPVVTPVLAKKSAPAVTPPPATPASGKSGLLVWYDFEEDFLKSGVVKDKSGSGRDGVVTGKVNRADGISGTNGIGFTGNGYLQTKDNPAAGRKEVTFSFWFRTADPTENYKFASAAVWRGGPGTGWTMATHIPEFWADDGPEGLLIPGEPNMDNHFVPDTWTHEAVVYDGTTMKEYTNGVLINTWHGRNVPMSKGVPMAVGGWPQFSVYNYVGQMDEFRIYDHALSAGEISALSRRK